jgi:peptidoglycan/xylan/chitin deacetylase (PgdA/CDA1 family)
MTSNPRIPYVLSSDRARLAPPLGKPIIVHFIANVEYWPFEKKMPRGLVSSPHGISPSPDVANFSWYEYGMRCGMPRIIRALQQRGVKVSCALNAGVIDVYRSCADAIAKAGWELIGHCYEQRALSADTEAEVIGRTLERIRSFTGKPVTGWLGSGLVETDRTPEILRSHGVRYVCDWGLDDLPSWMRTGNGPLIAMPSSCAIDDGLVFGIETRPSDEMYVRLVNTLKTFERELDDNPRVITIGLHPHLIGEPHRVFSLEQMLDLLQGRTDTIFMNGTEIADWFEQAAPYSGELN